MAIAMRIVDLQGHENQGCQIFLGTNIPNWEKYNK
jgi:hypothetical protein